MTGDFSPPPDSLPDATSGLPSCASDRTPRAAAPLPSDHSIPAPSRIAPAALLRAVEPTSKAPMVLLPARLGEVPYATAGDRDAVDGQNADAHGRAHDLADADADGNERIGGCTARLAAAFAENGWDIAFYDSVPSPQGAATAAFGDSSRAAAIRTAGERAGHAPRLHFLTPVVERGDIAVASALIAECVAAGGTGAPPRCLVVAPSLWSTPRAEDPASAAKDDVDALRWDSEAIDQFHQANVTRPLCLMRAHHTAWQAYRRDAAMDAVTRVDRFAVDDVSAVVLLDAAGLQRLVGLHAIPYAASQSALHATVPSLARAFAPGMRVTAISAPLRERPSDRAAQAAADTALAQALCYVAEASTLTGATLQVGGVPNEFAGSE